MSVTHYNGKKLYKVLVNGKSCHGGDFTWSLPVQNADGTWTPGDWTPEVEANLCSSGYHATWEPIQWANRANIEVYEVEFDDAVQGSEDVSKVVGKRCRLLSRIVDAAVLLAMHIVVSGSCEVKDGAWYASGSAQVKAYGSAQVEAYGSAQVEAYDSAQVEAYDSAQVEAHGSAQVKAYGSAQVEAYDSAQVKAYDSAQVEASGSAQVEAYGSAQVEACGSAQVEAYGSAQVKAYGSAQVKAYDSATVNARSDSKIECSHGSTVISCSCHSKSATVTLHDSAVHVDRRGSKPVCRIAGDE